MASSTRIELATYCLGGNCSILLSYEDTNKLYHITTKNRIKKFKNWYQNKKICYNRLFQLVTKKVGNNYNDYDYFINVDVLGVEKNSDLIVDIIKNKY